MKRVAVARCCVLKSAYFCYCVSSGLESFYFNFLIMPRQKIDVIASDVKGGVGKGKKELWQLSDESEASQPSADDEEAGHDEDVSEDGSVDSDGGGGASAARKPRPAKLIAVSSNDADRRQQRQVVCSLCLMSCGVWHVPWPRPHRNAVCAG